MFTNVTATEVTAIEKSEYIDVGTFDTVQNIDVFTPVAPVYNDVGQYKAVATHYEILTLTPKNTVKPTQVQTFRRARDGLMCGTGENDEMKRQVQTFRRARDGLMCGTGEMTT